MTSDSIKNTLQYFQYDHLSEGLQEISKPFHGLAQVMQKAAANYTDKVIDQEELYNGYRRLLEAKDCFVRAHAIAISTDGISEDGIPVININGYQHTCKHRQISWNEIVKTARLNGITFSKDFNIQIEQDGLVEELNPGLTNIEIFGGEKFTIYTKPKREKDAAK